MASGGGMRQPIPSARNPQGNRKRTQERPEPLRVVRGMTDHRRNAFVEAMNLVRAALAK